MLSGIIPANIIRMRQNKNITIGFLTGTLISSAFGPFLVPILMWSGILEDVDLF